MAPTDNAASLVRLTYLLPKGMKGRAFTVRRSGAPAAAEPATVEAAPEAVSFHVEPPLVTIDADAGPLAPTDVINLGLDLGRSETRVYDGETVYAFPTLIGGPVATIRRGSAQLIDEHLESNLHLKVGGHAYSVGAYAMEQPFLLPVNEENIFQGELNKVLLLTALGLLTRRKGLTGSLPRYKICLGLPVYLSRRPDYIESAVQAWLGRHEFEFCGEKMAFEIVQIDAVPQPVGAVYAAILNGQLEYNPDESIGVIDPGHLTTDWVVVRLPNELTQYSGHTTAVAGYRLYEAVSGYLAEQLLPRINPMAVQESLLTGTYQDFQHEPIAIPESLIEEKLALMAQQVALTVKQSWRDLRIHRMLMVGGFGRILYPLLTQYPYFRDLQLAEDPRYYNVKGFFEYAIATPLRESK